MTNTLTCPKCGGAVASDSLICSNCRVEIQPVKIYDTVKVSGPVESVKADFGAEVKGPAGKTLYQVDETELVETAVSSPLQPLNDIFTRLGVEANNCWVATNVPTLRLIENALAQKLLEKVGGESPKLAGDIDLIVGDLKGNDFSFERLIAFQVKIRKMDAAERLSHFSSGEGTRQSYFTALMGFDRTVLLHVFVREPKPVAEGFAPSWNPVNNSQFARMMRASYGAIRNRFARESYGYAWLGWGQAFGREPDECGGITSDVIVTPPFRPKADDPDVGRAREIVAASLANLLGGELRRAGGRMDHPFMLNWPARG
ncbi:MAG TPA: hypothetical protein VNZ44_01865 [Pyrinomonadaceae bacterium]|nr:hypothetical protein [Pyrinomonadaceae bacterium]